MDIPTTVRRRTIIVNARGMLIEGDLTLPEEASIMVVMFGGLENARYEESFLQLAGALAAENIATLIIDPYTPEEWAHEDHAGDVYERVARLGTRMVAAVDGLVDDSDIGGCRLGLLGRELGAAASVKVATARPSRIHAIVSVSGRPDLAGQQTLLQLRTPTLLVVGEHDHIVLDANRHAANLMKGRYQLAVIPSGTHRLDHSPYSERVARLASDWYHEHLGHIPG
ncbi:alpha/beta hydrolase family protein [Thiohalomonas denitrificans]|uniref:alpha/beta hydrolase family protein n=1 Tax=Thiohalomonas denitrificans TaxID=415747 RepID=UPI0026E96758|nr:hypothetical protein [Thiohalomonas denitrificans]